MRLSWRTLSRSRRLLLVVGAGSVLVALLSGPLATWLQTRGRLIAPETYTGAVYLVAGARAQDRRVHAAVECVCAMTNTAPLVLIGNDAFASRWSSDDQRNLTMGEWAACKVKTRLRERGRYADVRLLDGGFWGTHSEMKILAACFAEHEDISSVALVTSPYHARRCVQRFEAHSDGRVAVSVVPVQPFVGDRAPWIVAIELGKMARDGLGLGNCPFLTRLGWRRLFRMLRIL